MISYETKTIYNSVNLAKSHVLLLLWLLLVANSVSCSEDEYRLLQDLKNGYDVVERPVANHSEAVEVHVRILLQQILEIDERNQMITMVLWLQQTWRDYKLKWEPSEYGNITEVRFPNDGLWKPDIFLFNSADENFDARFAVNFVVRHTGDILQAPPAIIKSSCEIDITWFPFDEQFCFLKYGSWTYSRREVDLFIEDSRLPAKHKMDLQYYVENGAWDLIATPGFRKPSEFEGSQYVELVFYMWFRRKTIYYGINWIIPSILFLLSNILGFSLPAECGEKITLQTTNLLSVTVFLGMVAEVTPPTSTSVPLIGAFFALQMVLLGSSVIITILVINVSFRSPKTHKMSPFLRSVFLEWVPWLCMMTRPDVKFRRPSLTSTFSDTKTTSTSQAKSSLRSKSSNSSRYTKKSEAEDFKVIRSLPIPTDISRLIRGASQSSLVNLGKAVNRVFPGDLADLTEPKDNLVRVEETVGDSNEEVEVVKEDLGQGRPTKPTEILVRDTMFELREFLIESKRRAEEEDQEEIAEADWRFMALAIDRACMFIYAFLSIVLPVSMYLSVPQKSHNFTES